MYYVYIVVCADTSLYTGFSPNVSSRIRDHNKGKGAKYTRSRLPVRLIYTESFIAKSEALRRERQIKGWTRTKKIKVLNLRV